MMFAMDFGPQRRHNLSYPLAALIVSIAPFMLTQHHLRVTLRRMCITELVLSFASALAMFRDISCKGFRASPFLLFIFISFDVMFSIVLCYLHFFYFFLSTFHHILYRTTLLHTRRTHCTHAILHCSSPCIHIPPPGRSMPPLMCYHHPTLHHHRHHPTSSTDILIHVYLIPMALHNDQNCAYTLPTPNPSQPTLISAYSLISSLGSFIPLIPPFPSCIRDVSFFNLIFVGCALCCPVLLSSTWNFSCFPHQKRRSL